MFQQILQGLGGQNPNMLPAGGTEALQRLPQGVEDPVAKLSFLEKLGLGLGGIDAVNSYRTTMMGGNQPASLREWEAFNAMSSEDQRRYLQMKRANQMFDRGGSQVVLDPQGGVVTEIEKTLPPEQTPETKAAQTAAVKEQENLADQAASSSKKSREAGEVLTLADQAEDYLDSASGSYLDTAQSFGKRVVGMSDAETQANAALKVISGKLVSNMPRMEGPQSDKDVQLYKDMAANIADPTVPAQDKKVALQALRDLNSKYATQNANNSGGDTGNGGNSANTGGRRTVKFGDLR